MRTYKALSLSPSVVLLRELRKSSVRDNTMWKKKKRNENSDNTHGWARVWLSSWWAAGGSWKWPDRWRRHANRLAWCAAPPINYWRWPDHGRPSRCLTADPRATTSPTVLDDLHTPAFHLFTQLSRVPPGRPFPIMAPSFPATRDVSLPNVLTHICTH